MRKLQSPGRPPHHDRRAPTGRRRSTSGRACSACRSCSSSPTSTTRVESHLYFDPGDGRLITVFTNESRDARPRAHADRPRLRAPPRVRGLAGDVRAGGRAPRRARHPPQRRQGPRLHGLDLLRGPARAADRAGVLPLRAAGRPHARRRAARGAPHPRRARRPPHRPRSTSPTRSRRSTTALARVAVGRPLTEGPATARTGGPHGREHAEHPARRASTT